MDKMISIILLMEEKDEHWFWKLLRHPILLVFLGWFLAKYDQKIINKYQEELKEKNIIIEQLKDSRSTQIKELEQDKKIYLEKFQISLNGLEESRVAGKKSVISDLAKRGLLNSGDHPYSMNLIDEKYNRKKKDLEKEKNLYLGKIQIQLEGLRGQLKKP